MTDEETIQRPKGRRNNSIDLGPTGSGESAPKEKRSISLGRKDGSDETRKEPRQKPSFSFSRKDRKESSEKPSDADDVFVQPSRTEPVSAEPVDQKPAEERRTFSASIDLGQTQGQRKTMDMGQQDMGMGTAANGTTGSIDLGPTGSPGTADTDGPETKTQSKKRSALGSVIPFGKKEEEDRKGTWGDTGYHATDDQAHRDRSYHIPSFMKQTVIMFMVQMKLYSKMKWTYFMLFVALLIPIVTLVIPMLFDSLAMQLGSSTAYIGILLSMMPIFIGFFTAILCGPPIGREFKDRTAYMNVSLPVSRISFYIGKYLAGFLMSLGIFMFAYGVAVATAMMRYDLVFADLITESLIAMIASLFAYSATAFCIGAFTKRPSTMMPFILMTFLLPAVLMILSLRYEIDWLMLFPCFLPDVSVAALGTPIVGSVSGFFGLMNGASMVNASDMWVMCGIGIVWGVLLLALGMIRTMRREM